MMSAANTDDNALAETVEILVNYVGEPMIKESRRQFLARDEPGIIGFYTHRIQVFNGLMNYYDPWKTEHQVYQRIVGF